MTAERRSQPPGRLTQQTASSALWNGAGSAGVQLTSLLTYIVLAWTLGPALFGTAAMALALVALPRLLGDLGFAPAIVTGRLRDESLLLSAHWLVLGWGLAWSGLLFAAAPLAASFYQSAEVASVLRVAALFPLFDCAAAVPQALLQQRHRFDRIVRIDMSCQLGVAVAAIWMALAGFGLWALIVPQLVARGVRSGWLFAIAGLPLRLRCAPRALLAQRTESAHVMGAGTTHYLYTHADDVIVGRFFGAADLGLYSLAYNTLARCLTILSHAAAMPMLASLGTLRGDRPRFDAGVVRAARAVARLTLPLTLGGAWVAPLAIEVFFGAQWAGAESLLRCFLLVAALQSIGALTGPIWLALGRHRLVFWWGVATSALATLAFLAGAVWGGSVEWVAISFAAITVCITSPAAYQVTRRSCGLRLEGLLPGLAIVLLDVLAMLGVVAWVAQALPPQTPAAIALTLQVASGALAYAIALRALHCDELAGLISLLPEAPRRWLQRTLAIEGEARPLPAD